jgi:hypothetical protein
LPLQLSGKEVGKLVSRLEALEARLTSHTLWASSSLLPGLVALQHKQALAAAARAAKKELKAAHGLVLADELKSRMRVLRRLGYLDPGGRGAVWRYAAPQGCTPGVWLGRAAFCTKLCWGRTLDPFVAIAALPMLLALPVLAMPWILAVNRQCTEVTRSMPAVAFA